MLVNLNIKDFAIVEQLNLEFDKGMISLTGETGAGKSILLGAIGLVTGEKASKNTVRKGTERAVVSATFDISNLPKVKEFLEVYDYVGEDENECIIRRVVRKDGRSSSFINDTSASLNKIIELGDFLIEIHGQNQHQKLSKDKNQLDLLDGFLGLRDLKKEVSDLFRDYKSKEKSYVDIKSTYDDNFNSYQLLRYQLKELTELNLGQNEVKTLEDEIVHLESASSVISTCSTSLEILDGDESVISKLQSVYKKIDSLDKDCFQNVLSMIDSSIINLKESTSEISKFNDNFEVNPEREFEVNERLREINKISSKMNTFPEELFNLKKDVESKINNLNFSEDSVDKAKENVDNAYDKYLLLAKLLSKKRIDGAPSMSVAVNKEASKLNLSNDILKIVIEDNKNIGVSGLDKISFLIRPNLGQDYQPMKEIASGGEMSRISLSIQVVSLKNENTPTMIFDEVDAGLSGETGNVVGSMLKAVGDLGQVMCVTHLPQVAAQGHSHYLVSKRNVKRDGSEITISSIDKLNFNERIHEVARMIGGDISSKESFDSAKSMLSNEFSFKAV